MYRAFKTFAAICYVIEAMKINTGNPWADLVPRIMFSGIAFLLLLEDNK